MLVVAIRFAPGRGRFRRRLTACTWRSPPAAKNCRALGHRPTTSLPRSASYRPSASDNQPEQARRLGRTNPGPVEFRRPGATAGWADTVDTPRKHPSARQIRSSTSVARKIELGQRRNPRQVDTVLTHDFIDSFSLFRIEPLYVLDTVKVVDFMLQNPSE